MKLTSRGVMHSQGEGVMHFGTLFGSGVGPGGFGHKDFFTKSKNQKNWSNHPFPKKMVFFDRAQKNELAIFNPRSEKNSKPDVKIDAEFFFGVFSILVAESAWP